MYMFHGMYVYPCVLH